MPGIIHFSRKHEPPRDLHLDHVDLARAAGDAGGAAGTQCKSVATIHHLWRRCEIAWRSFRFGRSDKGQPPCASPKPRWMENSHRRQFTTSAGELAGDTTGRTAFQPDRVWPEIAAGSDHRINFRWLVG